MKLINSICILLFVSQSVFSQQNTILGHFSASENNGNVFMSWQIIAGSTCNGIQIYRSTDSLHFVEIGDIPGICGNISAAQDYDFTDYQPEKNKINYYRLQLGNTGYSEIVAVEIIHLETGGYQVRPNPVADYARIYFDNEKQALMFFTLYNTNGAAINSVSANNNYFDFDSTTLKSGLYFFSITNPDNEVKSKGKILVQHWLYFLSATYFN